MKCALILFAAACIGAAAPIPTLFNTGVDSAGALLPGGNGVTDTHFTVVSGPGIITPVNAVTFYTFPYWPNGSDSKWISATTNGGNGAGTYVFRTTFDLTGFDPSATSMYVRCATDNSLTSVRLNGVVVSGDCDGYGSLSSTFSVFSNFVSGINTLDFTVVDDAFPVGFRAQFTSDTSPLSTGQVPEPQTFALIGAGLVIIALKSRSR